ncbi:hypothetical protein [Nannocystis pusilla]|uniref:hypothetical protein n=1 Tax=Nannocystis pusilla TaxID=889268 RepID=UPI003B801BB8
MLTEPGLQPVRHAPFSAAATERKYHSCFGAGALKRASVASPCSSRSTSSVEVLCSLSQAITRALRGATVRSRSRYARLRTSHGRLLPGVSSA